MYDFLLFFAARNIVCRRIYICIFVFNAVMTSHIHVRRFRFRDPPELRAICAARQMIISINLTRTFISRDVGIKSIT